MSQISNKKKKFVKKFFQQLPFDELVRKTELKPSIVRSLIDEYSAEVSQKDPSPQIKKGFSIIPSWKVIVLTFLIFSAFTFTIYSPSLHGDFLFDDLEIIQKNVLVHTTTLPQVVDLLFSQKVSRRIARASFALNYYFGEFEPFGYHLVNVIIHILNGLVLFCLSYTILALSLGTEKKRGNAWRISFLGSLIWLVHPIQSQAVSYIVQRETSLAVLFFLLSLFCYFMARTQDSYKRGIFFLLSLLLGLLSLGTKQNTATLPFFIILAEFFFFQPQPFKLDRKKVGLIILCGIIFILIAGIYLGPDFISKLTLGYEKRGWTPVERILTQSRVIIFYLSLLIFPNPSRLNLDHDFTLSQSLFSPFTTFLSLLLIIGLLALAIFFIKRNRLVSYGLFWFFGNLVIESSIIPLELVFEHRLYLPSMGLIIMVIGYCFTTVKVGREKWVTLFIIPFIFLFSYWTYERAFVWRGTTSIWTDAVKKSPRKARPHKNLATAYREQAMVDEAISEYGKALAIDPHYLRARTGLGSAYLEKGKLNEAIAEFKQVLTADPNLAEAHFNLGVAYAEAGKMDEAIAEYKKELTANPNHAETHNNLGVAFFKKGMVDEAILAYEQALTINPGHSAAHCNLGTAYNKKGMADKAITEYKMALEIDSNLVAAYYDLAILYDKKGLVDEAIAQYRKALTIRPDSAEAYYKIGSLLESQGKLADAIRAYREVIRIKPDQPKAYNNIAWIYATSPDENIRNGHEAVLFASKACELTEFKKVFELDTLAAAYAETGNFTEAIAYQEKALSLATEETKELLIGRLELYHSKQAYRGK